MKSIRQLSDLRLLLTFVLIAFVIVPHASRAAEPKEFSNIPLVAMPENFKAFSDENGQAVLTARTWSYLTSSKPADSGSISAQVQIEQPASLHHFFGSSWSVWPDATFADGDFEAGLLLRGSKDSGYRVQLSHKLQCVALVKYPEGGYLRVVDFPVELKKSYEVTAQVTGNRIVVSVDGSELINCIDGIQPISQGVFGVGVSNLAKIKLQAVNWEMLASSKPITLPPHKPKFTARNWLGDRPWIFDGDEPILLLPIPEATYINNVKLRPGYKPQLSWNSHWGIENQGAYPEGKNTNSEVTVTGGGDSLVASWSARQTEDKFKTTTSMTIGYDQDRAVYTYDVDSELEVTAKEPFLFRYGYDFEHHTPLDPFSWQYLIVKRTEEKLVHRPVYPIDPGPLNDVEMYRGLRLWHGQHVRKAIISPAVEYKIPPEWNRQTDKDGKPQDRQCNTAVCAAFYDTGVSYTQETAAPGTKVHVKYRYTGYPTAESSALFDASQIYDSATLDPHQHWIFADSWPKISFDQFVPLSETWIYGRRPFMTAHNVRPTYELAKNNGRGNGYAMKLPAGAYGKVSLAIPAPLAPGKYAVRAWCKAENAHGPGGRIELEAQQAKTNKVLATGTHYVGNGTFDWRPVGFVLDLKEEAGSLSLAFGNGGTGNIYFADAEILTDQDLKKLPPGVLEAPNTEPPAIDPAPNGAVADYRMQEQQGHVVHDYANSYGVLELCNARWTIDEGRPALIFQGKTPGEPDIQTGGKLDLKVFSHPSNVDGKQGSFALAGTHGGGREYKAFTLSTWVKPGDKMEPQYWGSDIVGLGGRKVKLVVKGTEPPYTLGVMLNFGEYLWVEPKLEAGRWQHLTVTGEPNAQQHWVVRLYLNGKQVGEMESEKLPYPLPMPSSLVLGTELFYLNGAYYHGLIGRTTVYDRTLAAKEIASLAAEQSAQK